MRAQLLLFTFAFWSESLYILALCDLAALHCGIQAHILKLQKSWGFALHHEQVEGKW
jgi:hypothetical protein